MTTTTTLAAVHHRVGLRTDDELDRLRFAAVVGLVLLNACDLLLTRKLLGLGGVEVNPLMALVIHGHAGTVVKLGVPIYVGYRHLRAPLKRSLVLGLCWMCVLYLGVVLWNAHFFLW